SWPEKGLVVRQETKFPDQDATRLAFQCRHPVKLALKIRWPAWAKTPPRIWINGLRQMVSGQPSSYITLNREWRGGDVVKVRLPMTLHTVPLPGTTNLVAILYGPIVLAGELGAAGMPADPYARDQTKYVKWPPAPVPVFVADNNESLLKHIHAGWRPLTFKTSGLAQPRDVTLVPFYDVQHQRYTVYWQVLSRADWEQQKSDTQANWNRESARLTAWANARSRRFSTP
ncbi:MAG: DUF4986 domain-containing protein, partial [Limisphaerales bacterium]